MAQGHEPPLEELIGDPLTRLVMASDKVDEAALRALLQRAAEASLQRATQPKRQRR